jgi:hypothetical protein
MGKQALWGLLCMDFFNHALSGTNDAIIVCERIKAILQRGRYGKRHSKSGRNHF